MARKLLLISYHDRPIPLLACPARGGPIDLGMVDLCSSIGFVHDLKIVAALIAAQQIIAEYCRSVDCYRLGLAEILHFLNETILLLQQCL